jgi:hypothetical protein
MSLRTRTALHVSSLSLPFPPRPNFFIEQAPTSRLVWLGSRALALCLPPLPPYDPRLGWMPPEAVEELPGRARFPRGVPSGAAALCVRRVRWGGVQPQRLQRPDRPRPGHVGVGAHRDDRRGASDQNTGACAHTYTHSPTDSPTHPLTHSLTCRCPMNVVHARWCTCQGCTLLHSRQPRR